jgi:hypothetical protein
VLKDQNKTIRVNALAKPSPFSDGQHAVAMLADAVVSHLFWLPVVLLLSVGLVLYYTRRMARPMRREEDEKIERGSEEAKEAQKSEKGKAQNKK